MGGPHGDHVPALEWDGLSRAEAPSQRGQRPAYGSNYSHRGDPANCPALLLYQRAVSELSCFYRTLFLVPVWRGKGGSWGLLAWPGAVWKWAIPKVCAATPPSPAQTWAPRGRDWAAPRFLLLTMETTVLQPQGSACPSRAE